MTEEQRVKEEKKILPIAIVYLLILLVMVGATYVRGNVYFPYSPATKQGTNVTAEVVSVEPVSYVTTHHYIKNTRNEINFPDELRNDHLLCNCKTAQGDEFSLYIRTETYSEVFGDWGTYDASAFSFAGSSFKSAGPIEFDTPRLIKGKLETRTISNADHLVVTFQGLADEP